MKAITLLSISSFALAQTNTPSNSSCGLRSINVLNDGFNASGSVTIQGGFTSNEGSDSTWTFSRFVNFEQPNKSSNLSEVITLKTSKNLNLTDLKYEACMISLNDVKTTAQLPIKDDGSCSTVLGDSCISEIKRRIANVHASLDDGYYPCGDIADAIGMSKDDKNSNCTSAQWDAISSNTIQLFGSCEVPGSADSGPMIYNDGRGVSPASVDDFSLYDNAVGIPGPFVLVVSETTKGSSGDVVNRSLESRLMCIPADNVVEGSRKLPEMPATTTAPVTPTKTPGAAIRGAEGMGIGVVAVVGLTVLFGMSI